MSGSSSEPHPRKPLDAKHEAQTARSRPGLRRLQRLTGIAGVVLAAPFFVWLPLGLLQGVPSMVDIYGMAGLRIPAAVTICGLLVAAIGFYEQ